MRLLTTSLLVLGLLAVVHCDEIDDDEHPDAEDDHPDAEEEGDDEAAEPLQHYEDDGSGDEMTEKHMRELHKKFDHDKDGKVHKDEILKFVKEGKKKIVAKEIEGIFDEIPSTQDGTLSLEEHLSEMDEFHEGDDEEKKAQRDFEIAKFKAADVNNDGHLDKTELVHLMHPDTHDEVLELHTKEEMRKRDTNKDGRLSKEEWEVDAAPHEHQDPEKHDPHEDFKSLDADNSGFIDVDELRHWESDRFHTEAAIQKLMDLADQDGDVHLTADELVKIVQQENLEDHDVHPHLLDWVFHHGEL